MCPCPVISEPFFLLLSRNAVGTKVGQRAKGGEWMGVATNQDQGKLRSCKFFKDLSKVSFIESKLFQQFCQ